MNVRRWPCLILAAALAGSLAACDRAEIAPTETEEVLAGLHLDVYGLGQLRRAIPLRACTEPEHRQFDFWVGKWDVFNPAGNQAGTNIINSELDGCVVAENWTGATGGRGRSLNMYDRSTGKWYQVWIDVSGTHLRLEGGIEDGAMVMGGDRVTLSGVPLTDEITWTPLGPDEVRQFWEIRVFLDPPFTVTAFDGRYLRRDQVTPAPPAPTNFCDEAAFDQLDFWVGDWDVSAANGVPLGHSRVSEDLNNCLIEERFTTPEGYSSVSFLSYDVRPALWYRYSADNQGVRLQLSGGMAGTGVELEGGAPTPDGRRVMVRVVVAPAGADEVSQTLEISRDEGVTWKEDVTLVYERR